MVTRTPKQTQAALAKAARLSGLSRNVIAAQDRNMKTFLDEVEGKEKAAVTREDMTKVGLNPKLTADLTKYLNMQNKKGRKPIEDDFRKTIKAQDKPDVPLVSPSAKKNKPKTSTRGGKVIYRGGRPGGREGAPKKTFDKLLPDAMAKQKQDKKSKSILGKVKERVTQKTDAKPLRDPKELLNLVGGATALTRAAPSIISYLARNKGKKVSQKVVDYVRKLKDKRKDTSIRTQSGSGKTIRLGGANLRQVQGPPTPGKTTGAATRKATRKKTKVNEQIDVNKKIKDQISRRVEAATKRRDKAIIKNKVEKKPVVKQPVKTTTTTTRTARESATDKAAERKRLEALLQNPLTGKKRKDEIRDELKNLKKGGLIKRSVGGGLRDIPAGNKGLPNLPTAVRNKMGFKKKGGIVRRSKGGFLGAGKALRGQGAVMRKKGGKIAR